MPAAKHRKPVNVCMLQSESIPFTDDRSNVELHATDFTDLNTHGTSRGPIQEAGTIEIHGGVLDTGTPGRGLPVENQARVIIADSPLLQCRSSWTGLPSWPPTHKKFEWESLNYKPISKKVVLMFGLLFLTFTYSLEFVWERTLFFRNTLITFTQLHTQYVYMQS